MNLERGCLVFCSKEREEMLPWWWMHFHFYHSLPVAFIDAGLSQNGKEWCKKRGSVIPLKLPSHFSADAARVEEALQQKWETLSGRDVWEERKEQFQRPFALLQTPFETTIAIDVKCQVRSSLLPLFDRCRDVLLVKEQEAIQIAEHKHGFLNADEPACSSRLIVYKKENPLIAEWARRSESEHPQFLSANHLLARLAAQRGIAPELSSFYSWNTPFGLDPRAHVLYWFHDAVLKEHIAAMEKHFFMRLSLNPSVF